MLAKLAIVRVDDWIGFPNDDGKTAWNDQGRGQRKG